jgi:hypothetical protein
MRLSLPVSVLGVMLAAMGPAYAEPYFNCEYSPRCEAVQNRQCAPTRNLKDKLALVRSHNSAEEVEAAWAVLAGFEPEYCGRLGDRGNLVREFLTFKTKLYPKLHGGSCSDAQACAEAFVKGARERWDRDDLEARIKAEIERNSKVALKAAAPPVPPTTPPQQTVPESWQTTTEVARPADTKTRTVQSR